MNENADFTDSEQLNLLNFISLGDEHAFRQVYHHFYKRLLDFAFALVKNKEAAEELVEDVFIKFWKNRLNAKTVRKLKVYLYAATKNTSLNYLASKARENITRPFGSINIELSSGSMSPDQVLISRETFAKIKSAVETLPPRCKMVFKLIREDGLKYNEVAEILNLSPHTVDAQMTIAIRRIAFIVREEFDKIPQSHHSKNKS